MVALREAISQAIDRILDKGRAEGSIRPDITSGDIIIMGALLSQPLPYAPNWDQTARRAARIYVAGLAPGVRGAGATGSRADPRRPGGRIFAGPPPASAEPALASGPARQARVSGPRRGSIQRTWPSMTARFPAPPPRVRSSSAVPCRAGRGRGSGCGTPSADSHHSGPGLAHGPDRRVEGVPALARHVQPGRGVVDHPVLARGQVPGEPGQHVDGVTRPDRRRVSRRDGERPVEQDPLAMVLRPHERRQPLAGAGIAHVDRVEVDALHAGDPRQHVQVRRRHGAVDVRGQLHRGGGVPVPPAVQPVPVTVEPQVEPGAGAHFDQVYRPGHGRRDHGSAPAAAREPAARDWSGPAGN